MMAVKTGEIRRSKAARPQRCIYMLCALQDVATAAGVFLHHRDGAHALRRNADSPRASLPAGARRHLGREGARDRQRPGRGDPRHRRDGLQADEAIHEEVPVTDHRPNVTAKIEIRQLSVGYTGRQAVRGVDLAIPATSIYAWIGPAGSGKASTLRTINLLSIEVDGAQVEGEIVLDGKTRRSMSRKDSDPFVRLLLFPPLCVELRDRRADGKSPGKHKETLEFLRHDVPVLCLFRRHARREHLARLLGDVLKDLAHRGDTALPA